MASLLRPPRNHTIHGRVPSSLRKYTSHQYLPRNIPIEEETLPHYNPTHYYPVNIGDIYHSRYQITGKVGYGADSTSWVCRDLRKYTVLKISTSSPESHNREYKVYEHLAKVVERGSLHPGQSLIREVYDSFELQNTTEEEGKGKRGIHQCLILQPMTMSLLDMMRLNSKPFDLPLLKMTVKRVLLALDFLHAEAGVVHTDIKADNIMLTLHDPTILTSFADAESSSPSPRKISLTDASRKNYGLPTLCDFSEARIGTVQKDSGPFVQPCIYRAPEVIFEMPWGTAVDIWGVAGVVGGQHLFGDDIFDPITGHHDPFRHLARVVAVIGEFPSPEFVRRSNWIAHAEAPIPDNISLETLERRLTGTEKELFLDFMRAMLKWMPEERSTAGELLGHEFLR
ncbi:uncharacterized protein An11g10510 [Aspergillus niger]|uniref:Contig An11c0350, genomic contig n=2 Tax=Aspergillus niger TaxID=5061 RepID=A2QXW9_ASPNC|nr:uncharacterized protein An11g10510 [Aspergillus niger]CAK40849.1 unnamed protein product [Aspergillus niger]